MKTFRRPVRSRPEVPTLPRLDPENGLRPNPREIGHSQERRHRKIALEGTVSRKGTLCELPVRPRYSPY
jgi:hypothetical protein